MESGKISIRVTRDSVCAGDDGDAPHEKRVEVFPGLPTTEFAESLARGYLPSVAGVGHSWDCVLGGITIAILTSDLKASEIEVADYQFQDRVHFVYHSATY